MYGFTWYDDFLNACYLSLQLGYSLKLFVKLFSLIIVFRDDIESITTVTSLPTSERYSVFDEVQRMEDDRESVQSTLSTLPDSLYAGFERKQPPSSTPNKPQVIYIMFICGLHGFYSRV